MIKNLLDSKKVFIFDLDGTLIDSLGVWDKIDALFVRKYYDGDVPPTYSYYQKNILPKLNGKDPYIEYLKYLIARFDIKESLEEIIEVRKSIIDEILINDVSLKPYVLEYFNMIRGYKRIVLATTSTSRCLDLYKYVNKNTKELDFDNTFEFILSGNDVKKHKPDSEIYLKALELLGVKKEDIIVFEDSLVGIEAAKGAGLDVVHVYDEANKNDLSKMCELTPYFIENFKEIMKN